jgi:hypothetical protein
VLAVLAHLQGSGPARALETIRRTRRAEGPAPALARRKVPASIREH